MLELDGGVNYAGKVNFSSAGDAFDFDAAEPTANSWQFTIKDISDTGLATARVLIYLHDEAGTVGPDNVSTVLPANWKVRERYFNSPSEAIEYLTTVEADREAFTRQNSEACRNALAIYARRSNWKVGCLPIATKTSLFTTLATDGYMHSEALETTAAALAD